MAAYKKYLYRLTFPNGKVYIGVTSNIHQRWISQGAAYKGSVVGEAIQQFGWDNVKKEVLLHLPGKNDAYEKEKTIKKNGGRINQSVWRKKLQPHSLGWRLPRRKI